MYIFHNTFLMEIVSKCVFDLGHSKLKVTKVLKLRHVLKRPKNV